MPREFHTDRLLLRRWRPSDRDAFAAMNADERVMEFFPQTLARDDSDRLAARIEDHFERHGFGLWAVQISDAAEIAGTAALAGSTGLASPVGTAEFAGFIGLSIPGFTAHFTPCVEIGWRLAAAHWGHGYATEGARAVLRLGFESLGLPEIVSFTTASNDRSRRVMERIGMTRDIADDFDHPALPDGHPLRPHVLYRARASSQLIAT